MTVYAKHVSAKSTPQTEPVIGKVQVQNSAGGFVFQVDDWTRLDRFLILGSCGGTYYVSEKKLTIDNATAVLNCIKENGVRAVNRIVEISDSGRAPKNDPAIFALALAASFGDAETKTLALSSLNKVCRIGTHLFQFAESVQELRGWGRGLRRAIGSWYTSKSIKDLSYQLVKYQRRNGWSHRDMLRLCHVKTDEPKSTALRWAVGKAEMIGVDARDADFPLMPILAFEQAKRSESEAEIARLIRDYDLPRECIPTKFLNSVDVWAALLDRMPMTAMVRNLAKMTAVGLLKPMSSDAGKVLSELSDAERIKKSRLHPMAILMALKTYASGHGGKGKLTWTPVPQIIDALNEAFYSAFANVEPTGKRWLLAIDVSGSMSSAIGSTSLSAREAAVSLALVTANVEKQHHFFAFSEGFVALPISRGMRLDDAVQRTRCLSFGGTDCSLPMIYASEHRIPVDVFVVLTDNETYAGRMHPFQALSEYRNKTGIGAKMIVNGMTATSLSIADPNDAGSLDVVGFDADTPSVMNQFVSA